MTRRIVLHNESSRAGTLDDIVDAVDHQLHDLATAWGSYVFDLVDDVRRSGFRVVLLDNADQANALGYHDVGPDGKPYARVFVEDILGNGGKWSEGALSVSAVVSHEVCEMVGDPGANRWANDGYGTLWALELCDAVESDAYAINGVSVSDFLYPSYFNPFGQRPFDHLDVVSHPFAIARGGYGISIDDAGTIGSTFGVDYPSWRSKAKAARGSRTDARYATQMGLW